MKFIIWTWKWQKHVGGVRVMHKLCDYLNRIGEDACIVSENITNPNYITPHYNEEEGFDSENTVVIYPECITDNPLNAKHVVRWLLFHQTISYPNKNDYIFKYYPYYGSEFNKCDGLLRINDFALDFWTNENKDIRNYNTVLVRKGAHKVSSNWHSKLKNIFVYDDIEKEYNDENILKWAMNQSNIFLSYDASSFCSVRAALCGCVSIVVPDYNLSKEDWLNAYSINKYGVSYGGEDTERAIETLPLVKPHLESIQNDSLKTVHDFVSFWKEKLN
jgi:hypothetical protein